MKNSEIPESFFAILQEYETQKTWLESLITDPSGRRYLVEKTPENRLKEYQEQLNRTREFLNFLGNPQEKFHSIHVAGTGGKGSVTTMIGALLETAGQRVGVHTSPYLQVPNEKLLINRKMISPSQFSKLVAEFRSRLDQFTREYPNLSPRYGEAWVALTYLFFAQEKVDWAVIETSMGGRFDPTNILLPEVAVITNVDYDHVPQLGTTIEEIAGHKAGIIKSNGPAVTGEQKPEALEIIENEAKIQQAPLYRLGKEFSVAVKELDESGSIIDITTSTGGYENIKSSLMGKFQPQNAAVAVMAVRLACDRHRMQLTPSVIDKALSGLIFPGRMEKIQERPAVILDGAHNPQKTRGLAESLREIYGGKSYTLIVGMLATKDARHSIDPLLSQAERVIVSTPNVIGKPAIAAQQMKKIILEADPDKTVDIKQSVQDAITSVLKGSRPDDLIVVTGSIYMLGEARDYWVNKEQLLAEAEYGAIS